MSVLAGRPRVFRDPIHGDIKLPRGELQQLVERILDTPMFQRLRHIRQNGVLHLVFHGAEHSRFSHAMGVAWVAGRMFDAASSNSGAGASPESSRDREDTILAALLHDVGHGPFSHTLEEILRSIGFTGENKFDHEDMTVRIIKEEGSDIARLLGARASRLVPFIKKDERKPEKWFYSIVSSELDADRLDYVVRDSQMAGVWTHRLDLGRLIDALAIHRGKIVIDERARDVVESYLLTLDQMYASIYYHHTNRAASFLLQAIVQRAVDLARQEAVWTEQLFPQQMGEENPLWTLITRGRDTPLSVYEQLDENLVRSLLSAWSHAEDTTLSGLAQDLRHRRLPKVIPIRREEMDGEQLNRLGEEVREAFARTSPGVEPKYYVRVDKPSRKAYPDGPSTWENGWAASIKLLSADGKCERAEKNDRSVAKLIMGKAIYPSLIVPENFREEATRLVKEVRS